MGQYYHIVNLDKIEFFSPHTLNDGIKLMEHSYIDNPTVSAIKRLLMPGGRWHMTRIIWAGDYSAKRFKDFESNDENSPALNLVNELTVGDIELYDLEEGEIPRNKLNPDTIEEDYFVCNHTKKKVIDYSKLTRETSDNLVIDPFPILVSQGNGNGGGDFFGTNQILAGDWAGDVISVEKERPKGYTLFRKKFVEVRKQRKYQNI